MSADPGRVALDLERWGLLSEKEREGIGKRETRKRVRKGSRSHEEERRGKKVTERECGEGRRADSEEGEI